MAKINISRGHLIELDQQGLRLQNTLVGFLLASKLNQFYNENGIMIRACKEKRLALFKEVLVMDENGTPVIEGEGDKAKVILKEPIRETEWNEKMTQLMNEPISLTI